MSRCYPFPPPGFVPNQVRDESLIEPIKKGTKEEVKREKKDRKHNKDKKRKERDNDAGRSSKHHKRQSKDENANASSKKVESLEKSCLTIELDHQASSQTSCDSTLRSNENDKSQPLNGRHNDSGEFVCLLVAGSVLLHVLATTMMTLFLRIVAMGFEETSTRVLLHDKGQKYPEVMMTNKGQKQCSASSHQEIIGPSKLCSKCPPSTAMRFLKLIENWAPDRFESKLADSEDQEGWLLMKVGAKRHHQVSVQTSSKGSSSMVWPTAQILPEAELHALPFTVPF
ncbi:uncharacterized protein LOC103837828 isoform X1 [Brassica rapa]|uniref:Uncharacterized protein n=1 Tax=Brassica campestris TaxID=3711 RepID=M4F838_BRACM|nr:uncharacterized protein LOC103837828 isoform X1 [Brassica rapa]